VEQFFFIEAAGAALLGAILGSFVNALSFRFGTGLGMGGRSHCMRCAHTLRPLDLVPVLSFLCLRGACRYCGTKISLQYPLVECAAAALSLAVFAQNQALPAYALALAMWMALLFMVIYDLRHLSLPVPALWTVGILGLLSTALSCGTAGFCHVAIPSSLSLWAGPAVAAPLLLFSAVSRGRWMGWGDGLLAIGLGWFVGLTPGITALCIAFWSGAIVGLSLIGISRLKTGKGASRFGTRSQTGFTMVSEIPFAPFLLFGTGIVYFFHVDLFSLLLT